MYVRSVEPRGRRGAGDVFPVVVESVGTRQGQTSQTSSSYTLQTTCRHTNTQQVRTQCEENKSDRQASQQSIKEQVKQDLFDTSVRDSQKLRFY